MSDVQERAILPGSGFLGYLLTGAESYDPLPHDAIRQGGRALPVHPPAGHLLVLVGSSDVARFRPRGAVSTGCGDQFARLAEAWGKATEQLEECEVQATSLNLRS